MSKIRCIFSFYLLAWIISLTNTAHAESRTAKACFAEKDKQCLSKIYSGTSVINANSTTYEAIYLHGLLELEDGNFQKAKERFELGVFFGDQDRNAKKLAELLTTGKVKVNPRDCKVLDKEPCLLRIIKSGVKESGLAYHLLALHVRNSDPERAIEYTFKAAEHDHRDSACLLYFGYTHEKPTWPVSWSIYFPKLKKDYEKARKWGIKCGYGPFIGYNKKDFDRFKNRPEHRAYAVYPSYGSSFRAFTSDITTPELAVAIAGEICKIGAQRKNLDAECFIVNVDGEWVERFIAPRLSERMGQISDIITITARRSFTKEYALKRSPKVFAQGPLGNWAWRSGHSNASLEELQQQAVDKCQDNWRFKDYKSACEIININGEWIK